LGARLSGVQAAVVFLSPATDWSNNKTMSGKFPWHPHFMQLNRGVRFMKYILVILFKSFSFAVAIGSLGSKATSKKKLGKLGSATEKLVLSAETDTQKLHDYVCGSNLLKEGGEEIKIQPDSEYPDWLWTLRTGENFLLFKHNLLTTMILLFTGKFPDLSEMDPESKEYWLKVRRMGKVKNNKLMKFKRF
jgi:large subunit ribosomal protein L54